MIRYAFPMMLVCMFVLKGRGVAQVTDLFTDGDFQSQPTWTGDAGAFRVTDQRLQLAAPAVAGRAMLAVGNRAIWKASWTFRFIMDFNPSSSNFARFYLVSDRADLHGPLNGYFVQLGGSSDDVSLYRQSGLQITRIIDGADNRLNLPAVEAVIRVTTDDDGEWSLTTDVSPSGPVGAARLEGTVRDLTHTVSAFAGWMCFYTATRSDKFWLDDVHMTGELFPDRVPPVVTELKAIDASTLTIAFSEPMDSVLALRTDRYGLDLLSVWPEDGDARFGLRLAEPLKNGETISFQIGDIRDRSGNRLPDTTLAVTWLLPHEFLRGDVLINEFMADPSPPNDMPESEYVELLNRSDWPLDLKDWRLSDAQSAARLPSFILKPGEYVSLWPAGVQDPLPPHGIRVLDFPSLNNNGDRIRLSDPNGNTIDDVRFEVSWHTVSGKQEGGWSLERIDPQNICDDVRNWASCVSDSGGTPGAVNSVRTDKPDLAGPRILEAAVLPDQELELLFDEPVDSMSYGRLRVYPDPPLIIAQTSLSADRQRLSVRFADSLQSGRSHHIRLEGLCDCNGNALDAPWNRMRFMRPHLPDSMDLVINEVLFDPFPGGVDFVELFNRSRKHLQLRDWLLANGDADSVRNEKVLPNRLVPPGGYALVTPDAQVLRSFYPTLADSVVVETPLPSMPDSEGSVMLRTPTGRLIDGLSYTSRWHHPLIRSAEGVSLERFSSESATSVPDNWGSAVSGGGTPGSRNSLAFGDIASESSVIVEPLVAEGSGPDAFFLIHHRFSRQGLIANVQVVDEQGYPVRTLADGEAIASSGFFRWDLEDEGGLRARPGWYVVLIEIFDLEGFHRLFRRRLVIAP